MRIRTLLPALLAASALSATAMADTIYLTDGRTLSDLSIKVEGLAQIEYRGADRKQGSVASDTVLFVEFSDKPQTLDRGDAAFAEDSVLDALADYENYLSGLKEPSRKHPWARAYALSRIIEVHEIMGSHELVIEAADHLLDVEPNCRYVPYAVFTKAQAQYDSGKGASAPKTFAAFDKLIQQKQLSDRWSIASDLGKVLFNDSIKGSKREQQLKALSARAGIQYPVERNRAEVALGEALFNGKKREEAEKVFRAITKDPKADARTLAGAHTGLGVCLYEKGEPQADSNAGKQLLREAQLHFMRVVVSYKNEYRYVPQAMFFAGRCFQLIEGDPANEHATKLLTKVIRDYKGSTWAQEARGFRQTK